MQISINNRPIEVTPDCTTLSEILTREGFTGVGQAVAIDGDVVPKNQWASTPLREGMKIIVIKAVCGG